MTVELADAQQTVTRTAGLERQIEDARRLARPCSVPALGSFVERGDEGGLRWAAPGSVVRDAHGLTRVGRERGTVPDHCDDERRKKDKDASETNAQEGYLVTSAMDLLRTPDERFRDLPGWAFEPHYVYVGVHVGVHVGGVRVHYVDEGPRSAAPVLLLHGEPSWSFLYRKMIPGLVAAGHRVVAPDLVGFGRSDKPSRREDYTYQRHVDWMAAVVEALDLRGATLFCQDWGGLIGLRLVAEHAARFAASSRRTPACQRATRRCPTRSSRGRRSRSRCRSCPWARSCRPRAPVA